jgi:hypothetical protein
MNSLGPVITVLVITLLLAMLGYFFAPNDPKTLKDDSDNLSDGASPNNSIFGNGIKFGFGFGIGLTLWGIVLAIISMVVGVTLFKSIFNSLFTL